MQKKENQNDEFNKQEEKHFEFKRNAELDAVLKRKHKVATVWINEWNDKSRKKLEMVMRMRFEIHRKVWVFFNHEEPKKKSCKK